MRMRTHKSRYFSVSNTTAQDQTMSFAALGLLTYCLSKPGDWEFCPKQIWRERDCGRDKIYQLFNELIEKFHCIRIKKPNPKMHHLPGEIEYEFYDDIEDCKNRIQELEKIEKFIEHGYNLKKCLRRPEIQEVGEVLETNELWDPENTDPKKPYITKEREIQTKERTTTKKKDVVVPSFIKEIEDISEQDKRTLSKYPEDRVKLAIKFNKTEPPTTTKIQQLIWHCQQDVPPKPSVRAKKVELYDKLVQLKVSIRAPSCELSVTKTAVWFIHEGQGEPKEVKFSDPEASTKIKQLLFFYKFVKTGHKFDW